MLNLQDFSSKGTSMGSCISKCKSKRKNLQEECNHVQVKLVISQSPISPIPLSSTKQPLSATHSPTSSSSVVPSFSCTESNTSSSCSLSSSSSCSSSTISSKERSFSNEFLWSCVKENPHMINIDPIKARAQNLDSPAKPSVAPVKQPIGSILPRQIGSTTQKRARANSRTLNRQKSFRREPERPNPPYSLPSRALRSPSPSRRFSADTSKEICCKRSVVSKGNAVKSGLLSVKKENPRPASPNNNSSRQRACLMNRSETCTYRIGSKIDEIAVGEALSNEDINAIPMEDIDNPLVALDCFIFL